MPEGHTLHRLAGELAELVGHEVAASSPQGRFDPGPLDGATVTGVEAYGKHLLVDTGSQTSLHVHLGMRGKWLRFSPVTGPGLKQVRVRLARAAAQGPDVAWDLIAPSTCELLDEDGRAALLAGLGPDPLRAGADRDEAFRRLRQHRGSVGTALMDQHVLAGVGNVFRAEILHACGIDPQRPADQVSEADFTALWDRLQPMMARAVEDGRILTVDAPDGDRLAVPEATSRRVYKQAACYDCGTPVVTATLAGRTSYACPRCQPR